MKYPLIIPGVLAAGLLGSVAAIAIADPADPIASELQMLRDQVSQLQQAQSELRELRNQVDRLKATNNGEWMNERRAEEVKTLIREVLRDADTRASLLDDGLHAGHNGKKFFLASGDDSFRMNIGGQMQFRYIYNRREDSGDDDNLSGFQLRRTKLKFDGHVTANPKIKYKVVLAAERGGDDGGAISLEDFVLAFKVADDTTLSIGQMKLPFLREELLSSSRQLAVDRSTVTEYFTLDRGQGVRLAIKGDDVKIAAMVSDGADSEGEDFNEDDTDVALTGRVDVKLAGNWKQAKDFVDWARDELGIFVGGAVHYEVGETGTDGGNDNILLWTADGLIEFDGISLLLAVNGLHTDNETGEDFDDIGFLAQVGAMVTDKLQPYVRYELLDIDDFDTIHIVTAGCNYYINKHNAKFSIDVVYGADPFREPSGDDRRRINSPFSDGLGLAKDAEGEDGQVAVRSQFQLLF